MHYKLTLYSRATYLRYMQRKFQKEKKQDVGKDYNQVNISLDGKATICNFISQLFRGALFSMFEVVAQGYQLCLAFSVKRIGKAPLQISPIVPVLQGIIPFYHRKGALPHVLCWRNQIVLYWWIDDLWETCHLNCKYLTF